MSRSRKATVDYFPHSCNHGKTIHIIESKYGNDGYAFWFKLLELLGATENHFLDCNDPATWEYLLAKTRLTGENATFILNLLAALDSINEHFWKMKVIWSKNFIENLKAVYDRRRIDVFTAEDIATYCKQKQYLNGINVNINPHSRVKESKVKESKVESIGAKAEKLQSQIQSLQETFKTEWEKNFAFYQVKYSGLDLNFQFANVFDWVKRNFKKAKKSAEGDLNLFFQRWMNKEKPQYGFNKIDKHKQWLEIGRNDCPAPTDEEIQKEEEMKIENLKKNIIEWEEHEKKDGLDIPSKKKLDYWKKELAELEAK